MKKSNRLKWAMLLQASTLCYIVVFKYFWVETGIDLSQFLVITLFAMIFDALLFKWRVGYWRLPLPTIIAVASTFILMESNHSALPFVLAALFGILSKYFLRYKGAHVFNPSNFGILMTVLLFPQFASYSPIPWFWGLTPFLLLCGWSTVVLLMANRLYIALSYTVSILIGSIIWAFNLPDMSIGYIVGPQLSLSVFLFTFHMITDPATTGNRPRDQVLTGVLIGFMDLVLRVNEYYYATLLALVLYCSLRPILKSFKSESLMSSLGH